MRNAVVGIVIGCIVGIMLGATVIAPRMDAARTDRPPKPAGSETLNATPRSVEQTPSPATHNGMTQNGITLKLASAFSLRSPDMGAQITHFTDQIQRVSGGAIRISVQAPNAPIAPADFFDAISGGALDGAFIDPGLWADRASALNLFSSVPFGPGMNEFSAWYASGGGREAFAGIAKGLSMHALACGVAPGMAAGWFRVPVTSARSFLHLRIAAQGLGARVLARAGAKVFDMKPADTFMAMEEGLLDAAQVPLPTDDSRMEFNQTAQTYYFPGWHKPLTLLALMIRQERWDALTPARRAQIETVCGDTLRQGLGSGEAVQFAALKALTADDINIQRLPQSAINALKKAWGAVVREEAAKDKTFAALWLSLSNFRENYGIWRELSTP